MVYKNVGIILLFPYIFTIIKIYGHRCGWNQFWYPPLFIICLDGLLLSMASFIFSCSFKSFTFCCYLGLSTRWFLLYTMDDIAWLLLFLIFRTFHKLHPLFPWNCLKWSSNESLSFIVHHFAQILQAKLLS
jgi:hypothetical protein